MRFITLLSLALGATVAATAQIVNPSFESPPLPNGTWGQNPGAPWSASGEIGVWNIPTPTYYLAEAPAGAQIAYVNAQSAAQQTGYTLHAGAQSFRVMAGRRHDTYAASFWVQMWAGGSVGGGSVSGGELLSQTLFDHTLVPPDSFTTVTTTFVAPAGHARLGQALTVRFLRSTGGVQMNFDDVRYLAGGGANSVSGRVSLDGFQGDVSQVTATIDIYSPSGALLESIPAVTLSASGAYSINTSQTGVVVVGAKGRVWLRGSVAGVVVGAGPATNVDFNLRPGDCDDDNDVDIDDYDVLASAYGSVAGGGTYSARADLDGDDDVDIDDYDLLAGAYGGVGFGQ